ncbi:MAG: hypothetical protein AAGH78_11310 [Cyanobacteria bacterium P01_H01_bin.58]
MAGATADELDEVRMRSLIDPLLMDLGPTRHVTPKVARKLLDEIRHQRPNVTDVNLLNQFVQHCGEALLEQVPVRPQPTVADLQNLQIFLTLLSQVQSRD